MYLQHILYIILYMYVYRIIRCLVVRYMHYLFNYLFYLFNYLS